MTIIDKKIVFLQDEEVEWQENPTFVDDDEDEKSSSKVISTLHGYQLSGKTLRRGPSVDDVIKSIQNDNIDNSVAQLCLEVSLLAEEDNDQVLLIFLQIIRAISRVF